MVMFCLMTSYIWQNADIDAEFRRYSRGTQLSLKAWNGDELDLGLVCFSSTMLYASLIW